ncbi:MAG: hypothetical protein AAFO02_00580 [Bacteroidota bacterium]
MAKLPSNTINRKSQAEVIIDWFEGRIGDHELTEKNLEYFERVKSCYRSQMDFRPKSKTIKMLIKTYKVSRATAQRLYNETETIWGSTQRFNQAFMRHQAIEMAKSAFRKAKLAKAPKQMVQAINAFIRASGIENEAADIPLFENLQPGDVYTMLPEAIGKMILDKLEGGVVDLNQNPHTIEIAHEEVTSGD